MGGLGRAISLASAMLGSGAAAGPENRAFVAGMVFDSTPNEASRLDPDSLAAVSAWLAAHRAGWRPNMASPPVPLLRVSLDSAEATGAVCLLLWPGRPGWDHAVILEEPAGNPVGIRTLDDGALTGLLQALDFREGLLF